MWAIVFLLANVICHKVDARYINMSNKGEETSEDDKEFAKLEKRQQITGELEINGQRFESLGCWRDAWTRGLHTLEGEHYLLMDPNYRGRRHALFKCARAALDKGRKVFGIENGGQCFASYDGENEYRRYGASKDCKGDGKGGPWSLQVYRFADPSKTINGDYSHWSPWTQCSKSCGGGVRRRMRKCSSPPPSNGGRDCRSLGPSVESQDCNVKLCNGNFGVGTPESHIVKSSYTNGNQEGRQVRQFTRPKESGNNIDENQVEPLHNTQYMGQPAGQDQPKPFNSNSYPKKAEEKHIPMSPEDVKNFKQIASFQKSVSNSGQNSKNFEGQSPSIPSKDVAVEGNGPKQPMSLSSNPETQRKIKAHHDDWYKGSKPFVPDNSHQEDVKDMFSSAAASSNVNSPSINHVGPAGDDFLVPKIKAPSINEQYINGNNKKPPFMETNKMTAAESLKNSKEFNHIDQQLTTMKPDVSSDKSVALNNQEHSLAKQYFDHLQNTVSNSQGVKNKPSGHHVPIESKNGQKTDAHDTHQEDMETEQSKPPATFKENVQNEKGKEMQESLTASSQRKPVASSFNGKASKEVETFTHQKLSDKEKQEFGQKQGASLPMSNKLQGAFAHQVGGKVDNSYHGSMEGTSLSMTKEKPSNGMNAQQLEKNAKNQHDVGNTVQGKYPQQVQVSSKAAALGEEQNIHSTAEGERNGKQESEQGPSDEGEPVPMVDLNKGAAMGGIDYSPTNGEEFPSPGEDSAIQNHEGGAGEDYGPENGESPMSDTTQQSRPVYDNEAIQGISDISQREDEHIIQQANSEGQAGPDGGVGIGYDDTGMSQAYTGETSRGKSQGEIEPTEDESMIKQQESNSSLGINGQSQEKSGARLASDYYNTEPDEDCLCPKKECSAKADVAFLVDGSGNIPQPYYARVLEFIKIFSRGFDKSNTHIGLMAFGDNVKTALDLKGLTDFRQFDDAVNIAPYIGGKAFTGNALLQMKTTLFAVSGRQDAPRALILLSSGGSADDVVAPAEELRDSGVKVTTIGLGKQANVRELINIASEPKSEHVFTAFLDTLPNAMDDIVQEVCRDVMGIVRDRQVPCTCETNNGQVGPSSDDIKDSYDKQTSPTGINSHQEPDLRYSHNNGQSETGRRPYSQGETLSYPFEAKQGGSVHDNGSEGSQSTEGTGRAEEGGHVVYNQQAGQVSGASEKQAEMVSSGIHFSELDSRNDQQNQNLGVSSGELGQEENVLDSQKQLSRLPENNQEAAKGISNAAAEDYSTNSEEDQKFQNGRQFQSIKNSQDNNTQDRLPGTEDHRFAAGFTEHYQPQNNALANKGATAVENPLNQDQTLPKTHGPRGNSFQSMATNTERVQGSGSRVHPGIEPSPNEDIHRKLLNEPNYSESNSKGKYEPSPEYKVPSKIIAVGKAAENFKIEGQQQNIHECGKVHLGVVLDSSSSHEGRGKQQAAKMVDLAKQVSHLFPVSHEGNSVGMVVYGGSPQPSVVHFDKFLDQKSMDQAIDNASDANLEIRIGKALTVAQKNLFSQPYTSKHKVLLLVTDGFSSDDVSRPAIELKRRGIEVFCLGVGNNVNQTQLDFIASEPKSSHVFLAPFNDADALMGRIQKEICQSATRAARLQTQRKCPSDLGFVIDGARSVEVLGKGNFKKMLAFVKNVSLGFHISPEGTRVGAITYGTDSTLAIPFNKYFLPQDLAFAIENIKYPGTITMTGKALALASQKLFDRGSRVNVPKVLVVLTEGTSRDNVEPSAQTLHKAGVTVISVGLGPVYNTGELNNIASMPAAHHVIKTKFNELQDKVTELQDKICQAKHNQPKQI